MQADIAIFTTAKDHTDKVLTHHQLEVKLKPKFYTGTINWSFADDQCNFELCIIIGCVVYLYACPHGCKKKK